MVRLGAVALVIAAALATLAPGAAAARQLRGIGLDKFRFADGSRYALFPEDWGLRIVDTVDGGRSAFDYTRITGTEDPYGCDPGGAHHGLVVVNCRGSEWDADRPWVVDLTTFEAVTPPGDTPRGGWSQPLLFGWVGTHWIASNDSGTRIDGLWVFWNWHTGEQVSESTVHERVTRDLDTPELAVRSPDLAARNGRRSVWERHGHLTLRARGQRTRLGACPCSATVALSGGRVAWISGRVLQSYRIRDGSRIRWQIPGEPSDCEKRILRYTRNRLYVTDFCEGDFYVTRWPSA